MTDPAHQHAPDLLADRALTRPALILGSLPPHGRDLDLLIHDHDRPALHDALTTAGYTRHGTEWIRFTQHHGVSHADVLDLSSPADGPFTPAQGQWLLSQGQPLPGYTRLTQPVPGAGLLLFAHRGLANRPLSAAHSQRLIDLLSKDPAAFSHAQAHAPDWNLSAALHVLHRRAAGHRPGPGLLHRALTEQGRGNQRPPAAASLRATAHLIAQPLRRRLPHHPAVVLLTGADASHRLAQANFLNALLHDLGHDPARCPLSEQPHHRRDRPLAHHSTAHILICTQPTAGEPPGPLTWTLLGTERPPEQAPIGKAAPLQQAALAAHQHLSHMKAV